MAYHDDLIEHAVFLSELNLPDDPKQVDLRRAVSAAYYALFHLKLPRTGSTQANGIDSPECLIMAA
jgi:hypothetical protein